MTHTLCHWRFCIWRFDSNSYGFTAILSTHAHINLSFPARLLNHKNNTTTQRFVRQCALQLNQRYDKFPRLSIPFLIFFFFSLSKIIVYNILFQKVFPIWKKQIANFNDRCKRWKALEALIFWKSILMTKKLVKISYEYILFY